MFPRAHRAEHQVLKALKAHEYFANGIMLGDVFLMAGVRLTSDEVMGNVPHEQLPQRYPRLSLSVFYSGKGQGSSDRQG